MKCITFQKPNIYHLFFLGYFIVRFSREYLNDLLFKKSKYKSALLYRMYVYILSQLLSFIPYFISRILSKRRLKVDTNNINDKTYIYNNEIKKYKGKFLFKQIFIISLFGFFSKLFYIYFI